MSIWHSKDLPSSCCKCNNFLYIASSILITSHQIYKLSKPVTIFHFRRCSPGYCSRYVWRDMETVLSPSATTWDTYTGILATRSHRLTNEWPTSFWPLTTSTSLAPTKKRFASKIPTRRRSRPAQAVCTIASQGTTNKGLSKFPWRIWRTCRNGTRWPS